MPLLRCKYITIFNFCKQNRKKNQTFFSALIYNELVDIFTKN
jgi:hypothetical protein